MLRLYCQKYKPNRLVKDKYITEEEKEEKKNPHVRIHSTIIIKKSAAYTYFKDWFIVCIDD